MQEPPKNAARANSDVSTCLDFRSAVRPNDVLPPTAKLIAFSPFSVFVNLNPNVVGCRNSKAQNDPNAVPRMITAAKAMIAPTIATMTMSK